jgi:hypothetical protein
MASHSWRKKNESWGEVFCVSGLRSLPNPLLGQNALGSILFHEMPCRVRARAKLSAVNRVNTKSRRQKAGLSYWCAFIRFWIVSPAIRGRQSGTDWTPRAVPDLQR